MTNTSSGLPEVPDPARKPARNTRADQDWFRPDRVFIDLDLPHLELARCLETSDDARIWELYRSSRRQGMYVDSLAGQAGARTEERRHSRDPSRMARCEQTLLAAAFMLPPGNGSTPMPAKTADRDVAVEMLKQLQDWMGYQQEVSVIMTGIPYRDVCRWSPVTQQEQLRILAKEPRPPCPAPWLDELAPFPEEFPDLLFIVGSVRRWFGFPELPEPGWAGQKDWDLRVKLAGHLSYAHHRPVQAHEVLLPAAFVEAVLNGLRMWLDEVARRKLVRGWQMHPGRDDLVLLELTPVNPDLPAVLVPIRRHQVGWCGLDLLMTELQLQYGAPPSLGIAPN